MSDVNITDWLVFRPAGVVRNARAYIDLPAFSYSSQGTAGDASVIVAQYNFSASQDFYLATLPVKPTGVTYGLCIRWRVGETVYRYKLWEDASFNLTDVVTLYARQRIRANFVLEVWNFPGVTSVQGSAIRMITSVRTAPTDFRTIADYALAVGAAFTSFDAASAPTSPSTDNLIQRNTSEDLLSGTQASWPARVGNALSGGVTKAVVGTHCLGQAIATFNGSSQKLTGLLPSAITAAGGFSIYIVCSQASDVVSGAPFALRTTPDPLTGNISVIDNATGVNPLLLYINYAEALNGTQPLISFVADRFFLLAIHSSGTTFTVEKSDEDGVQFASYTDTVVSAGLNYKDIILGSLEGTIYNDCSIAEILVYNAYKGLGSTNPTNYLRNKWFGLLEFPITFDSGSAWLDNAPL